MGFEYSKSASALTPVGDITRCNGTVNQQTSAVAKGAVTYSANTEPVNMYVGPIVAAPHPISHQIELSALRTLSQRRLQWIGSVMRMKVDRLPRRLVSSWIIVRRPLGRPLLNYGQSLDKDLRSVGLWAGDNWSEIAQDKNRWAKKIKVGLVAARLADKRGKG